MNNHTQIQGWMATYADLSPAQRAEVDAHLALCSTCARIFQTDQRLAGELHALIEHRQQQLSLQPQAQPQHARTRFQQKLRQAESVRPFDRRPQPYRAQHRWLTIAATLLLLLFLGLGVGQIWGGISLLIPVYATGTPQSKPIPTVTATATITATATPHLGIASPTPQAGVMQLGAIQTDVSLFSTPEVQIPTPDEAN